MATVLIGSDHRGVELSFQIAEFLLTLSYQPKVFPIDATVSIDYPDIAFSVARAVSEKETDRGILICGTGIGMSITANRVSSIRAALCRTKEDAFWSRAHNDSNILCLSNSLDLEFLGKELIETWLTTPFSDSEERHARRLQKIDSQQK